MNYESGCSGSGTSDPALSSSPYSFGNDLYILYGAESGSSANRYSGEANTGVPVTVNFTGCNGAPPGSVPPQNWFSPDILSEILKKIYTVASDGSVKGADDLLQTVENATMKFKWNLVPLQESPGTNTSASESTVPASTSSASGDSSGSSSTESPAKGSLPGIPEYPNSDLSQLNSAGMLQVTTKDSIDKVVQWYTDELAKLGWTLGIKQTLEESGGVSLMFTKDSSFMQIIVNSDGETTSIMINLLKP